MNNYVILYLATIDNHANEGKSLNILHKKDRRSSFSHDLLFIWPWFYIAFIQKDSFFSWSIEWEDTIG